MSGLLLATYVALWVLVCVQTVMILVLFRQLGIMVMGTARGADESGIPVGRRLPPLTLETLTGNLWAPTNQDDRPFLLFFGGHYCEGCKDVLPHLEELRRGGLEIVTLLMGDPEKSRAYAAEFNLAEPVIVIDDHVSGRFDVEVTPFAYAVDGSGIIRGKGIANHRDRLYEFATQATGEDLRQRQENELLDQLTVQQRNGERP